MFKRIAVVVCLLLCLTVGLALAQTEYVCGDLSYAVLPDGTAMLTGFLTDFDVEIPNTVDGIKVTAIGDGFSDKPFEPYWGSSPCCSYPNADGLAYIGDSAFAGMYFESDFILPKSLKRIGNRAFSCSFLGNNVVLPEGLEEIGDAAFWDAFDSNSITIPNSLSKMGYNPFAACNKLAEIFVAPDHPVFEVKDGVLFDKIQKRLICYPLGLSSTEYTIPDGTRIIDRHAFSGAAKLVSLTIPNSVTEIRGNPFAECGSLTEIRLSPNHPTLAFVDGVLFDKTDNRLISYMKVSFYGSDNMWENSETEAYEVPEGIVSIEEYAFAHHTELDSITLPQSLKAIGNCAFESCKFISITIPDGVTAIGNYAFSDSYLISIKLPKSLRYIGICAFGDCIHLESIEIPDGLAALPLGIFIRCEHLQSVRLPDSITEIGDGAFFECFLLSSITMPDRLRTIGDYAFSLCDSLVDLALPESLESIGRYAFYRCEVLKSVTLYEGLTEICDSAFSNCYNLAEISLPESLHTISASAFNSCSYLQTVKLPDGLKTIGDNAFEDCRCLSSINLPGKLDQIGNNAFNGCENLVSLSIPNSVKDIGEDAFKYCPELCLTVTHGSYTEEYAIRNELAYTYSN